MKIIPTHIGIIMDGNGRWAAGRGLPRNMGHRQGAKTFEAIVRHASGKGIEHLTFYAFSTENWNRPADEVDEIMNLMRKYLSQMDKYHHENMCIRILGDKTALETDIQEKIVRLEDKSSTNTGMRLNIALNYGGRDEITRGARELARRCVNNDLDPDSINEKLFSETLYTAGQPDVDLVIRTSGELRISNFLLWQSAYAEYIFTNVLWPDFSPEEFDLALEEYSKRDRRMGGRNI